ncbi:ATP-dependent RNA helicase tdrd9, partial [Saguinus oedipus]
DGASQWFPSLVSGCTLLVKVFSVVHSILHVDVYKYSGVQDAINIRDVLIQQGYAELTKESYESKVCAVALDGARVCVKKRGGLSFLCGH